MKIRHDIHTHTLLSSCCYDPEATVEHYARRAAELGHTVFGISNHLWDEKVPGASKWYHQQMINFGLEGSRAPLPEIHGIRFLVGTESEYCAMTDTLGMLAETAVRFDFMLIPHSHIHMKNFVIPDMPDVAAKRKELAEKIATSVPDITPEQAKRMANGMSNAEIEALLPERTVDVIKYNAEFLVDSFKKLMANTEFRKMAGLLPTSVAHPFAPCGFSAPMQKSIVEAISDSDYADCFTLAKNLGVNIEINTGAINKSADDFADEPMIRVMRIARECGCTFTFGTDTHSLKGLDSIRRGDRISELCGIGEEQLAEFVR